MEAILTFISLGSIFIFFFFSINILLKLYNEKPPIRRRIIFSVAASVLYSFVIYGTYALYGFQSIPDKFLLLITIPNPLFGVFCYFGSVKILRLSSYKSINVVRQVFIYMLVIESLNILLRRTFFVQSIPYNYLLDAMGMLLCDLVYLVIHFLITAYINRHNSIIMINDSLAVKNKKHELTYSMLTIVFLYSVAGYLLTSQGQNIYVKCIVSCCMILCLAADILLSYDRTVNSEIKVKNTYITSLCNSIDSFNHLKIEFKETLTAYDSYLELDQIDLLKAYHELLMDKTILTSEKMELSAKAMQNPAVVSLLLNKIDYAEKNNVLFFIPAICNLQDMYIDDTDLCRILGNLLDNAIESAVMAPSRRISFSIKQKDETCKVIIISNSTKDDVNIDKISVKGISTKEGHSGQGLTNVRNTIRKYGNSSLYFTCFQNEFSVYIELWKLEGK